MSMKYRRSRRRRAGRRHGMPAVPCLAIMGLSLAGVFAVTAGNTSEPDGTPTHGVRLTPNTTTSTRSPEPSRSVPPLPRRGAASPRPPWIPRHGAGTFTAASGSSEVVGHGRPLRYVVQAEAGSGLTAASVATEVERILADQRGWTTSGVAFQRVAQPPYDFRIRAATPDTADAECAAYGLDTHGELNCNVARTVVVNIKRWILLSPQYKGRPADYHALIINHEVGHFLGRDHQGCPGPGMRAPVMMQQIKGLHGCVANPWPYDGEGTLVTGPPASP
ncbi:MULTISPECIES: DUF3152 domain-containing protein [unclassified Streptomyces]|uniref:DUF3152 domain-containing protein n=1 Tax=unclassified Streptomyces TaxID=2593676 RepID=UPI002E353557|nr:MULTISPECIES: DUF3152 domain-containing protein [unclassified Streptomyces]